MTESSWLFVTTQASLAFLALDHDIEPPVELPLSLLDREQLKDQGHNYINNGAIGKSTTYLPTTC